MDKQKRAHRTSTLFLNLVSAEIAGMILAPYVGKPYGKTVNRIKNNLIKKAFKL